jgi:hypothetical protein
MARKLFVKWLGRAVAVNARSGGLDKLLDSSPETDVQQVEGPGAVGFEIDPGVIHGLPDTGPGRQIDNSFHPGLPIQNGRQCLSITNVRLVKREVRTAFQPTQPPVLESHVVSVVEIVQSDDLVATFQKKSSHSGSDKPGRSRDQISSHPALH